MQIVANYAKQKPNEGKQQHSDEGFNKEKN